MINYTTNNKNRTNGNIRTRYEAQYTTNEKNTINGNITTRYEVQYTTNDKNTTMRKGGGSCPEKIRRDPESETAADGPTASFFTAVSF